MKKNRKRMILWLMIFLFSLGVCFAYLKPHYALDTYKVARDGYDYYAKQIFLREARPFSAMLTFLAGWFHLPIDIYVVVSFVIGIAFLSLAVVILYSIFLGKKENTIGKKLIILMISYMTIFSYMSVEFILFLETCVMAGGVLLSVIACKVFIEEKDHRFLKAFLILSIAVFCYQGAIAIFPMILLCFYAIIEPLTLKEYMKMTIKLALLYGGLMFLTILYTKLFFSGDSRIQIAIGSSIIQQFVLHLKFLTIQSLMILPPFFHIAVLLITLLFIFIQKHEMKAKGYMIFKVLWIYLASIAICMMPIVISTGFNLYPRMSSAYGYTIGIFLFFMLQMVEDHQKWQRRFVYLFVGILFVFNVALYVTLTNQNILVNQHDRFISQKVMDIVEEYEENTGIKVTSIDVREDHHITYYLDGCMLAQSFNQIAMSSWAVRDAIMFYTGHPLQIVHNSEKQSIEQFENKDWDAFSEEQVYIEGDILYFCIY